MSYATLQDLIDRFGERELVQLTDRTNRPATTIDPVTVERALEDARAEVDSYVGKVHALPIAVVPPILKRRTADIAFFHLNGRSAAKDSPVDRAYRDALAWLRDLSAGKVQIDVGGAVPEPVAGGTVHMSAPVRRFTRDSQRGL